MSKRISASDYIGAKYGKLTIIGDGGVKNGKSQALCQCECGQSRIFDFYGLRNGKAQSCGMCHKPNFKIGDKIGRFTIIGEKIKDEKTPKKHGMYPCRCECGREKLIDEYNLSSGKSKSCGCLISDTSKMKKTHGREPKRLYRIWSNMRNRCTDTKTRYYKDYGGRGIRVCDEWEKYENFRDWAFGNGYKSNLTIDRIDNNGNYEPSNCRWATAEEQAKNRRSNIYINLNGETKILKDWCRYFGTEPYKAYTRYKKGIRGYQLFN